MRKKPLKLGRITLRVTDELEAALVNSARDARVSTSALVRQILQAHLHAPEAPAK